MKEVRAEQRLLCIKCGAQFLEASDGSKVGLARNVRQGVLPINGVRHVPVGDTSGWYIWAGETLSVAEDFFQPLHIGHLHEDCPQVIKYLGLAPGWRFLIAGDYEDVWFDADVLKNDQ